MWTMLLSVLAATGDPAAIHVDATQRESTPVPRRFFGQFAEHIGFGIYGGQWAQILRNPGFEGYDLFTPEVLKTEQWLGFEENSSGRELGLACYWLPEGEATYALDEAEAYNSRYAQRLEVASQGGVRTPIRLPLHRERRYLFSLHTRAEEPATGRILLQSHEGATLDEQPITLDGSGSWQRHEIELTVPQGPKPGGLLYLVIRIERPGRIGLDQAELFPADHIDGFDPDVVQFWREARTSLLRFPGGNFVSAYHWKEGIGPRDQRRAHLNPAWPVIEWNHVGTDEWMAFARTLGAQPLICINCGSGSPEEAADWVRYCNEPATGRWGAVRAANGHPTPYNVRDWEVGNELWGHWQVGRCNPEQYARRYDAFASAMLEADPTIHLIANGGPGDWNARFLSAVNAPVPCLSMHRLIGWGPAPQSPLEDVAMALAAYGLDLVV